jgi:hypothetical protein
MRNRFSTLILAFTLVGGGMPSFAEDAAGAGKVVDVAGKPVEHTTVIVHSALRSAV